MRAIIPRGNIWLFMKRNHKCHEEITKFARISNWKPASKAESKLFVKKGLAITNQVTLIRTCHWHP